MRFTKIVTLTIFFCSLFGAFSACSSDPHPPELGDFGPVYYIIRDAGTNSPNLLPDSSVPIDSGSDATVQDSGPDVYDAGLDASVDAGDSQAPDAAVTDNGIEYHGGPVMQDPLRLTLIWYGTWNQNQKDLIKTFILDLNQSPWFNINQGYYGSDGGAVTNQFAVQAEINDPDYSLGHDLTEGSIQQLSLNALAQDGGTFDQNAVYMVMGAADVSQSLQGSNFCTSFCGWHDFQANGPISMKYLFVGNPENCLDSCAWQQTVSPNGDVGVDAMLSVIAHELSETVTDPEISAWYNATRGMECADMCQWHFGSITTLPNGAQTNVTINNRNYLIQQNWVNANGGYCGLHP